MKFNRAVPVLSALFKYAEALKMRRPGSNPCRGMPRYKRQSVERYLTPAEYRRIGAALREAEADRPAEVAIARLLLFTGARVGEALALKWGDIQNGNATFWIIKSGRSRTIPLAEREPLLA